MTNYMKGARFEREICNFFKDKPGYVVLRSAGSHSLIDVVIIDTINGEIYFVQSKKKKMSDNAKHKIYDEMKMLNNEYFGKVLVITSKKELNIIYDDIIKDRELKNKELNEIKENEIKENEIKENEKDKSNIGYHSLRKNFLYPDDKNKQQKPEKYFWGFK